LILGLPATGAAAEATGSSTQAQGEWAELSPPIRSGGHSAVYDPVRDRMAVFGGHAGNTVWVLSGSEPAWTVLPAIGTPPPALSDGSMVYDPIADRLLVFGGRDDVAETNRLWELSLIGIPTWAEVHPVGPIPQPRQHHAAVFDSVRNALVVIGGIAGGQFYNNDVWTLSLSSTPTWAQMNPSGDQPAGWYGHRAILDVPRDRVLVFGGQTAAGATNDLWQLALSVGGAWTKLIPAGDGPSPRAHHSLVCDRLRDRMIVCGGWNGPIPMDIWAMNLEGAPQWTELTASSPAPSGSGGHSAAYDRLHDRIIVYGGGTLLDEAWALNLGAGNLMWTQLITTRPRPSFYGAPAPVFDPVGDRLVFCASEQSTWALSTSSGLRDWQELETSGGPPPTRSDHTAIYDMRKNRIIVFGGVVQNGGCVGDLWELRLDEKPRPVWNQLSPDGARPSPRTGHTAIYDWVRNQMVVFGGYDCNPIYLDDVWALSLDDDGWTDITPAPSIPGRNSHAAIFDPGSGSPDDDRMVIFGGDAGGSLSDTWALSLSGTPTWTSISPPEGPSRRSQAVAICDPLDRRMVMFGGAGGFPVRGLNETWAMSLTGSPTWTLLDPSGPRPGGRYGHAFEYDWRRDRAFMYGWGPGILWDVWMLNWARVPSAPSPPTQLSVTLPPCQLRAVLSWQDNSNDELGFEIQTRIAASEWALARLLPPNSTSWTTSELSPGVTQSWRVRGCIGVSCSEWSSIVDVTVPAGLSPPTHFEASLRDDRFGIELDWDAVPGATGYRLTRRAGAQVTTIDRLGSFFTDLDMNEGVDYSYSLATLDGCGQPGPDTTKTVSRFYYPVFFVHGVCSKPDAWSVWAEVFGRLDLDDLHYVDLRRHNPQGQPIDYSANARIEESAGVLQRWIEATVPDYTRVNIVSHSMGGIVARYYIEKMGGRDRVNKLIMLGVPNHGAGAKHLITSLIGHAVSVPGTFMQCLAQGEVAAQLGVDSEFLRCLNYGSRNIKDEQCPGDRGNGGNEDIGDLADHYWTIAGTGTEAGLLCDAVEKKTALSCGHIDKSSDGLISVGSVRLDALQSNGHNLLDCDLVGRHLYHAPKQSYPSGFPGGLTNCSENYQASTMLAEQVVHILKGEELTPTMCVEEANNAVRGHVSEGTVSDTLAVADLLYHDYWQDAGTVRETSVVVPRTPEVTFFCMSFGDSVVELRLRSPSGQPLAPVDTTGRTDILFRNDLENRAQFFVVAHPEPGTWGLITDSGTAPSTELVNLTATIRSLNGFGALMDSVETDVGTHIRIRALVGQEGQEMTDAHFHAVLAEPGGAMEELELYDDGTHGDAIAGDFVFSTLRGASGPGVYRTTVRGAWVTGEEAINRAASDAFDVGGSVDLSLSGAGIVSSEVAPDSGDTIRLSVTVRNLGIALADSVMVQWILRGGGDIGHSLVSIPATDSATAAIDWVVSGGDTASIFVSVATKPGTSELRYDNNSTSGRIPISQVQVGIRDANLPRVFRVLPARPNPTHHTTDLIVDLPHAVALHVDVIDIAGRRVRQIVRKSTWSPGRHRFRWDTATDRGDPVQSGVFFVRVRMGTLTASRTVVVLR